MKAWHCFKPCTAPRTPESSDCEANHPSGPEWALTSSLLREWGLDVKTDSTSVVGTTPTHGESLEVIPVDLHCFSWKEPHYSSPTLSGFQGSPCPGETSLPACHRPHIQPCLNIHSVLLGALLWGKHVFARVFQTMGHMMRGIGISEDSAFADFPEKTNFLLKRAILGQSCTSCFPWGDWQRGADACLSDPQIFINGKETEAARETQQ